MKIVSSRGSEISSLDDWPRPTKKNQWKEGRSAYSVADFILNRDGAAHLESRLSEVLRREVSISLITPEKEIRFDRYGRGRVHDLAIYGADSTGKTLFVGLEAKVDEKFGQTVQDRFEDAQKQLVRYPRSRAAERIKTLPAQFSPSLSLNSMLDIRYQLVHGTAGTVAARQENGNPCDTYVFYVLVFKTSLYDEHVGQENHQDFMRFISRAGGSDLNHQDVKAHSLTVDNKPLTCIYEHLEIPPVLL